MQRKLTVLASLFIWNAVASQQYSFVRFTIENGLSNNVVYSTHQDGKLKKKISGLSAMAFTI
jgi:hypothetical protein